MISYFAAWMPSQVDDSLIKILSLAIPSLSYNFMKLIAFWTCASLSKDKLNKIKKTLRFFISVIMVIY